MSLTLTPQGEYQFVALNGEEMHTEETFDALSKREQEQFSNTIDELEVSLRNMVRQLTEWKSHTARNQKLNDEVTLDVIAHFIKN